MLCGDVDTGLSKEDCAAILQQNGYSPIETLVPAKKLFTLFPRPRYFESQHAKLLPRRLTNCKRSSRRRGPSCPPSPRHAKTRRLGFAKNRTPLSPRNDPKGRRHDCTACLILCEGSKSRGYTASLKTIPWAPSFTKKIHRLVARFEKAERSPNKPLYLEARYDDLLPPPARKQDWFRKLPKARL